MGENRTYGGLLGAFPYAFRQSPSWVFRSYVLLSAIVGLYVTLLLVLGGISWIARPSMIGDIALLGVLGILVLVPLFTPVLVVARRYRLTIERPETDRLFGLVGYVFLLSLYLGLLITDPAEHTAPGPLETVFVILDGLPEIFGFLPPVVAVFTIYLVIRTTRESDGE